MEASFLIYQEAKNCLKIFVILRRRHCIILVIFMLHFVLHHGCKMQHEGFFKWPSGLCGNPCTPWKQRKRRFPAVSFVTGPGGSRTRVQKSIPCTSTIIVRSFSFPPPHGNEHPCGFSSFMIRLSVQSFADIVSRMVGARFPRCGCPGADMRQLGRS